MLEEEESSESVEVEVEAQRDAILGHHLLANDVRHYRRHGLSDGADMEFLRRMPVGTKSPSNVAIMPAWPVHLRR